MKDVPQEEVYQCILGLQPAADTTDVSRKTQEVFDALVESAMRRRLAQRRERCFLSMTNGKFIGVVETCPTVVDRFEAALEGK